MKTTWKSHGSADRAAEEAVESIKELQFHRLTWTDIDCQTKWKYGLFCTSFKDSSMEASWKAGANERITYMCIYYWCPFLMAASILFAIVWFDPEAPLAPAIYRHATNLCGFAVSTYCFLVGAILRKPQLLPPSVVFMLQMVFLISVMVCDPEAVTSITGEQLEYSSSVNMPFLTTVHLFMVWFCFRDRAADCTLLLGLFSVALSILKLWPPIAWRAVISVLCKFALFIVLYRG